jgi:hypothetical protein
VRDADGVVVDLEEFGGVVLGCGLHGDRVYPEGDSATELFEDAGDYIIVMGWRIQEDELMPKEGYRASYVRICKTRRDRDRMS